MREIKFRAWDNVNKKMIHSPMAICSGAGGWVMFTAEVEGLDCGNAIHPIQQYELMQFTGLKDRLGKEIYEGDILGADWQDRRYPIHPIGPVKWDEENARWDLGEGGSPKVDAQYHFEIIGNIYETPELIERVAQ